ncbi:MAG: peptidoglycan-binding protein, partial [Thermoleophilia bacterium]|nr:peptidoglycan-binding protein [Thermoleophilia bacterium]
RRKLRRSTLRAAPLAYPELTQGANGDLVRWAQMHLAAAGFQPTLNGVFDVAMTLMVQAFQQQHGIPLTGALDQPTWRLLLAIELPAAVPAAPPAA